MLAAIYSLIYHQSRKEEEVAVAFPDKLNETNYNLMPSEEPTYGDGFLFSSMHSGTKELQLGNKRVYQQKRTQDYRYPFYQTIIRTK